MKIVVIVSWFSTALDLSDHRIEAPSPFLPVGFHCLNFSLWRQGSMRDSWFFFDVKKKESFLLARLCRKARTHNMTASCSFRNQGKHREFKPHFKTMLVSRYLRKQPAT